MLLVQESTLSLSFFLPFFLQFGIFCFSLMSLFTVHGNSRVLLLLLLHCVFSATTTATQPQHTHTHTT